MSTTKTAFRYSVYSTRVGYQVRPDRAVEARNPEPNHGVRNQLLIDLQRLHARKKTPG